VSAALGARVVIVFMAMLTSPAALRRIEKSEELLLNYGEGYWSNMMPEEVNAEASKNLSRDDSSTDRPSSTPPLPAAKKAKTAAPPSASVLLESVRPDTSSSAAAVHPDDSA
jgi:hypothetical protein